MYLVLVHKEIAVHSVEERGGSGIVGWALALEFEHDHAAVVTRRQ